MHARRLFHLFIVLALGCSGSPERGDAGTDGMDASTSMDGAVSDGGPGWDTDSGRDAGDPGDAGPVVCGGDTCLSGFFCCELTGACYDPADPTACLDVTFDAGFTGVDGGIPGFDGAILPPDCVDGCPLPLTCCFSRGLCCDPSDIACCPRP